MFHEDDKGSFAGKIKIPDRKEAFMAEDLSDSGHIQPKHKAVDIFPKRPVLWKTEG